VAKDDEKRVGKKNSSGRKEKQKEIEDNSLAIIVQVLSSISFYLLYLHLIS
jgi:hypothetical protein